MKRKSSSWETRFITSLVPSYFVPNKYLFWGLACDSRIFRASLAPTQESQIYLFKKLRLKGERQARLERWQSGYWGQICGEERERKKNLSEALLQRMSEAPKRFLKSYLLKVNFTPYHFLKSLYQDLSCSELYFSFWLLFLWMWFCVETGVRGRDLHRTYMGYIYNSLLNSHYPHFCRWCPDFTKWSDYTLYHSAFSLPLTFTKKIMFVCFLQI